MAFHALQNISDRKKSNPHPWERVIKPLLANKIKHAHNSVKNPLYPTPKKKIQYERTHFGIVGDMVTKEFIYCTNLVKGLHKYRSKQFDAPDIRGVTTVEWPNVLNDLKIRYGDLAYRLESSVAVVMDDKFLGGEKELREVIEAKYNYHIDLDYYQEGVNNFARFIRSSGRSIAYMHISIADEHVGTLIFMLYSDIVPYTCENFLRLCVQKKGGYSGTPVHRIVKNCWIQCGGYGLKNVDLDCENYIIPHDRRGVLGMANDGRNVDCSTQFFVLLQPAPWMACNYVAFGQLIDGEATLQKIESVPTFYESPLQNIVIYRAGILNMECQDIAINKMTKEYIQGHIEDLVALGERLYEELMDRVAFEIVNRKMIPLEKSELVEEEIVEEKIVEEEMGEEEDDIKMNIRATQRFIRKKRDLGETVKSQESQEQSLQLESHQENDEFDVEVYEYEYEPEEESYKRLSISETASLVVKPELPHYIPLTDVLYPGEKDSTFDIKNFLKGDFCTECDVAKEDIKKKKYALHESFASVVFSPDTLSLQSLDSDDAREIQAYLKMNVDRVSFAGNVIKTIARGSGKTDLFESLRGSELITDEELRRIRIASADMRAKEKFEKKVSISIPASREPQKIKRRQTGFIRAEDIQRILSSSNQDINDEEEDWPTERKVRISSSQFEASAIKPSFRHPGSEKLTLTDAEIRRQSVLTRLYENVTETYDEGPTLKEYKPKSEVNANKNMYLTHSPKSPQLKSDDDSIRERYGRRSTADSSVKIFLDKKNNKTPLDNAKPMDHGEHRIRNSMRCVEYAKTRPALSVLEYQMKNHEQEETTNKRSSMKHDNAPKA